ncbi:hypothetical protein Tco_0252379, partial [Tanacetum coccineum]
YALWDVIENGNSFKPATQTTTNDEGTSTTLIPGLVTADKKVQKKNDVKASSMLLMALPNENLMTFNQFKDAKTLFAAIQTRFGGNEATMKTHKTLLKQMYENFSALMIFDDSLKQFQYVEQEVKGTTSSSSSSSSQNMAFVSSPNSTNEVNTTYGVSTVNTEASPANTQVSTAKETRRVDHVTSLGEEKRCKIILAGYEYIGARVLSYCVAADLFSYDAILDSSCSLLPSITTAWDLTKDAKRPGEDMCGSYRVMWRGYGMSKEGYGARWSFVQIVLLVGSLTLDNTKDLFQVILLDCSIPMGWAYEFYQDRASSVKFPVFATGVPVGPVFLLGLLALAIDAACAFRAEEMPSLISCWMAAKVMAGVSDVDVLLGGILSTEDNTGYDKDGDNDANGGNDDEREINNVVEEEDEEHISVFLGGNSSSGTKKYQGSNSNDGGNTRDEVKIAGGVIGSGDRIEFSKELKELLPDEARK